MEIIGEDYSVIYDSQEHILYFEGIIRLNSGEYEPISKLLSSVIEQAAPCIIVDLTQLTALNSSGITTLGRFVLSVHKKAVSRLIIKASEEVSWQKKSIKNFRRLMPALQLEWMSN